MWNPVQATKEIFQQYCQYISSTLPLRDQELNRQLNDALREPGAFLKGPYLEATSPFETHEQTYADLIEKGLFCSLWKEAFPKKQSPYPHKGLRPDQRPYRHQYESYQKLLVQKRNLVLATGTGSGKTESFLLPIIDYLLRQHENKELTPGVRALLLYPMNALANDQLKRLREILQHFPYITFGRYTGETPLTQEEAVRRYREIHQEDPLPNELLSREVIREGAPHILLTNFAMLEYLLLRPMDSVLFEGGQWRFIVLDEAHTYDGASGIEMAMLLRRLKDRVVKSEPGRLQCIATSATLGAEENAAENIAHFARELFAEEFTAEDVVQGKRLPMQQMDSKQQAWTLQASQWPILAEKVFDGHATLEDLAQTVQVGGAPDQSVENAKEAAAHSDASIDCFLFHLLRNETTVHQLQKCLEDETIVEFDKIRDELFAEQLPAEQREEALVALVSLATRARPSESEASLLPARYHVFIRTLEGCYVRFYPEPKLFLAPRLEEEVMVSLPGGTEQKRSVPVFEAASCTNCGALFLVGQTTTDEKSGAQKLAQKPLGSVDDVVGEQTEFYWVLEEDSPQFAPQDLQDEDASVEEMSEEEAAEPEEEQSQNQRNQKNLHQQFLLCAACGRLHQEAHHHANTRQCDCGAQNSYKRLIKAAVSQNDMVKSCPACLQSSQRQSIISRFFLGQDAPVSVMATMLYAYIPPKSPDNPHMRQLISFADSRQDAAFFAPYLERTHNRIQWRRLIYQCLWENAYQIHRNQWGLRDLSVSVLEKAQELGFLAAFNDRQARLNEVWRYLLLESLHFDAHYDLAATGCVSYKLRRPEPWAIPTALQERLPELEENEVWTLYEILLHTVRKHGAVSLPRGGDDRVCTFDFGESIFYPRNRQIYLTYAET
ncbi:MAG: DEAD/DEAH box helicase, partial [Candidatus Methanomethyliaceae archaeon]